MPNIQPENNYFYVFSFVVNLGVVNSLDMKSPNESVSITAKIPYREYIEWKRQANEKRMAVSRWMIQKVRENKPKPPIQKEPWTEEELGEIQSMSKQVGMGEHRRMIEAAAIRCKRAKRTAQNKDTQI